jgi:hypothetical protein
MRTMSDSQTHQTRIVSVVKASSTEIVELIAKSTNDGSRPVGSIHAEVVTVLVDVIATICNGLRGYIDWHGGGRQARGAVGDGHTCKIKALNL